MSDTIDTRLAKIEQTLSRTEGQQRRQTDALERQADALEDLADQLATQNAILVELVRQQERRLEVEMERPPDETRTPEARATSVQDNALSLAERVDIDDARRWADDE